MTDKKTEALKLALEALEDAKKNHGLVYVTELCAIREALAEQPAQQQCMEHGECFGGECIYPAPQPAQDQGQSCYCPECERLSKELDALKAQQQEPVAWMYQCSADSSGPVLMQHKKDWAESGSGLWTETPLYTSLPASKPWVGLTELEALGAYEAEQQGRWGDHVRGLLAVEAKLREKNT